MSPSWQACDARQHGFTQVNVLLRAGNGHYTILLLLDAGTGFCQVIERDRYRFVGEVAYQRFLFRDTIDRNHVVAAAGDAGRHTAIGQESHVHPSNGAAGGSNRLSQLRSGALLGAGFKDRWRHAEPSASVDQIRVALLPAVATRDIETGEILSSVVEVEHPRSYATGNAEDHGLREEFAGVRIGDTRVGQRRAQGRCLRMGAGKVGKISHGRFTFGLGREYVAASSGIALAGLRHARTDAFFEVLLLRHC